MKLSPPSLPTASLSEDADFAFVELEGRALSFALKEVSSSPLLAVCKRWMRVRTPSLYETVAIRSVVQARALATALKANNAFGLYLHQDVTRQGQDGASVPNILKAAPSITDLCVSLVLTASDNAKPRYDALFGNVKPVRLVIVGTDMDVRENN